VWGVGRAPSPAKNKVVILSRLLLAAKDLGVPRDASRTLRGNNSRVWHASIFAGPATISGSASFGKGMASAMPKQQPTSTALAAEVELQGI
jgi:hypothetical protein